MKEPEKETVAQSMVDIVDVVSDYQNKENAIGYSYYYYITTMYSKDKIKLLSVNGIGCRGAFLRPRQQHGLRPLCLLCCNKKRRARK